MPAPWCITGPTRPMSSPSIRPPAATMSPRSSRPTSSRAFTPITISSGRWKWCRCLPRPCPQFRPTGSPTPSGSSRVCYTTAIPVSERIPTGCIRGGPGPFARRISCSPSSALPIIISTPDSPGHSSRAVSRGLTIFGKRSRLYRIGDFSRYDLPVKGLDTADSLTLRIRLVKPFPQFVYILAMQTCAPIPRELIDYWLTTESDGRGGRRPLPLHERNPEIIEPGEAVGTGPYLLDIMKRKWKIRLVRNPDFRPDFYPSEGQPAFGRLSRRQRSRPPRRCREAGAVHRRDRLPVC